LQIFKIPDTNELKTMMAGIKVNDEPYYNNILMTMSTMLERVISSHHEHSEAMVAAQQTRRTDSPNMVANKYPHFQAYWVAINSVVMDVYILCLLKTKKPGMFIALTGTNHARAIAQSLNPDGIISVFNASGSLTPASIHDQPQVWKILEKIPDSPA